MQIVKQFLILALLTVPFFCLSQINNNIFENGKVKLRDPKSQSKYRCAYSSKLYVADSFAKCASLSAPDVLKAHKPTSIQEHAVKNIKFLRVDNVDSYFSIERCAQTLATAGEDCVDKKYGNSYPFEDVEVGGARFLDISEVVDCPPDDYPNFKGNYQPPEGLKKCFDIAQVQLVDSCNISSGNQYLSNKVEVGKSSICHTQSDGSICSYNAVDIGGGNQVYQLDLEGDCYSEPKPDVVGSEQDLPSDSNCKDYGNKVLACQADPKDVCTGSGSTISGNEFNTCNQGCGYINNQFVCIDTDTDSDGLPDYNDPDIDGDGIKNEDDPDKDGDGKDDPINGDDQPSGGGGGGSTTVEIDLSPVVNELKKANSKLDKSNDELSKINETLDTKLTKGDKGSFDLQAAQVKVDEKKQELKTKLAQIESEAKALIGTVVTSTATFGTTYDIPTLNGHTKKVTTTQYSDEMRLLALAILFLFTVAAAFVVLGGLGGKK